MKHDMETILLVARAIACHSAPDKAQLWEANAALDALAQADLLMAGGFATQPAEKESESAKTRAFDSLLAGAIDEALAAWARGTISPGAIFDRLSDIRNGTGDARKDAARAEQVRQFMRRESGYHVD